MSLTEQATTHTLDAPGATLTYDIRPGGSPSTTPLFLIGSPMGAGGFGSLASHFTDRPVITYDPRGSERSQLDEPTVPPTPEQHADDVHLIIRELGGGPVHLFASSGGAVNALALLAAHPEDVAMVVAHEPPVPSALPDREAALAASAAVADTYRRRGWGAGMAHFIALTSQRGEIPADFAAQPVPDPASFGLPTEDDGSRNDPLLGLGMVGSIGYEPDFDALAAAAPKLILGAGAESEGELANRGAYAVAERLGKEVVVFPSHHGGFLGGEYGQAGEPEAFAAKLRQVLDGS